MVWVRGCLLCPGTEKEVPGMATNNAVGVGVDIMDAVQGHIMIPDLVSVRGCSVTVNDSLIWGQGHLTWFWF